MAKIYLVDGTLAVFMCPGCGYRHYLNLDTADSPRWQFTGTCDSPTFTPSVLYTRQRSDGTKYICHSFIREGNIEFLMDSTHILSGKIVVLDDIQKPR